ncbi:MAG: Nucleic acid binding, OB-fold, tRNA/helicase-type [uncultured bacterium]|nr:MAG: Nucleic acid binding, OB-fold, tRNA/helicase-type [uncultured bacterium]
MKKNIIISLMMVLISSVACNKPQAIKPDPAPVNGSAPTHVHEGMPHQESTFKGKVTQTMDSGGYTYIAINKDGKEVWAATKLMKVAVGDDVAFAIDMPMTNFTSKTLNRTFDQIYFVKSIQPAADGSNTMPANHPDMAGHMAAPAPTSAPASIVVAAGSLKKADGGYSVDEIFSKKTELAGKSVQIRGKVVKFTPQIMGKNWAHIKDGTGSAGSDDLTITTSDTAKVGDTVLATGTLVIDQDFGAGYKYPALVEKAKLVVE